MAVLFGRRGEALADLKTRFKGRLIFTNWKGLLIAKSPGPNEQWRRNAVFLEQQGNSCRCDETWKVLRDDDKKALHRATTNSVYSGRDLLLYWYSRCYWRYSLVFDLPKEHTLVDSPPHYRLEAHTRDAQRLSCSFSYLESADAAKFIRYAPGWKAPRRAHVYFKWQFYICASDVRWQIEPGATTLHTFLIPHPPVTLTPRILSWFLWDGFWEPKSMSGLHAQAPP
jgi:hypothetical protein